MENKTYFGLHTIPAAIKMADSTPTLQPITHPGGSAVAVTSQASTQDVGPRVVPVLYIQGSGPPVQVGAHVPVPSAAIGHQKITSHPVLLPPCCQPPSVPTSSQITLITTFTQPTLVQTYSQATLLPSESPTLLSTCSQHTLTSTSTQQASVPKSTQPSTVPTSCQANFLPPSQSGVMSSYTRPVFVSSVTRPSVIPSLVPSSAQFLPPLAPKPPISTNTSPNSARAPSGQPHSPQLSTSQRFMIQGSQPSGSTSMKSSSYAYVGTLLRQEMKIGDSAQKILLANVPLPLASPSGSSTSPQQHKMASLILPVSQMNPGKTSVINLKIANRHILPDGKASVTVLREAQPPPLQPISKPPKLVSISSGQVIQDVPFLSPKEQSHVPPLTVKKQNQEKFIEVKKIVLNDKRKKERELSKCLKDAVDVTMKQKYKQKDKAIPIEDIKLKPLKSELRGESDSKDETSNRTESENMKYVEQESPSATAVFKQSILEIGPSLLKKEIKVDVKPEKLQTNASCADSLQFKVPIVEPVVMDPKILQLGPQVETCSSTTDSIKEEKGADDSIRLPSKVDLESNIYSEDFDPINILEWKDGIGRLPGSDLKFRMNEFNLIEIVDDEEYKMLMQCKKKSESTSKAVSPKASKNVVCGKKSGKHVRNGGTSTTGGVARDTVCSKSTGTSDDIHCCLNCGCYGIASEFYRPGFCSTSCFTKRGTEKKKVKDTRQQKLQTRRRKLKRLLQRERARFETELKILEEQRRLSGVYEKDENSDCIRLSEPSNKKKKLPWLSAKGFSWPKYLDYFKAKAAPTKLFKDPFPYNKNGFKIGMKLEGIDPEHPAYFCVLTVADIQGYRIRLTFDGYSDMYDFWVNADSLDIFPAGWCERNGHELHPPKNYKNPVFNWSSYLKQCRSQAAPRHLFNNKPGDSICPNGFRLGMKLEAVDRKNSYLVCVATVADLMDHRILVHFDSWDDIYDYWADPSSPYIHPVGWCKENGHTLTPPLDYKPPESFSWDHYLKQTKSQAAPSRAFKQRSPCGFCIGMKLECVDKWVPKLIRVATVDDVSEHQIKITFDGWSDVYSYWVDDDSPDIHPVGWCQKTGHDLEPPMTPAEMEVIPECLTRGCPGIGHVKGPKYNNHHTSTTCPYAMENLQKDNLISDRLYGEKGEKVELPSPPKQRQKPEGSASQKSKYEIPSDDSSKEVEGDTIARRLRKSYREKDQHTETETLPVKHEAVTPVLRSGKARKFEDKEEDPDWSVEMEKPCGKRKSEKDEINLINQVPKVKNESKQTSPRTCKQRRSESCEKLQHEDSDWAVQGIVRSNSGNKRKGFGNSGNLPRGHEPTAEAVVLAHNREQGNTKIDNKQEFEKKRSYNERLEFYSSSKKCCLDDPHFSRCHEVLETMVKPENEPKLLNLESYLAWAKHYEYLDFYTAHIDPDEFVNWSASEVAQFVSTIPGCEEKTFKFIDEEIDGEVFLLLSLVDLVRRIGLKLGPALKLYNCINMIRVRTIPRD